MIRRCYRLVYSLIFLLTMAVNVSADTTMSGAPITADTTWALSGSPYIVNGSILVMTGVTLTIEPGVEIRFGDGNSFQVEGMLVAEGTESQKITFTANNSAVNWGYLLFSDSSTDATYDMDGNYTGGSILKHCIVEYAGGADVENNGAVRLNNAHPFFDHITIRNNQAPGIKAWDISGTLKIINSTVSYNSSSSYDAGGINVDGKGTGNAVYISNSTIDNNIGKQGGIASTTQNVTLRDNTITNNTASYSGGGIYLHSNSNVTLKGNTITNNTARGEGGGIHLYSSKSIVVENNTMTSNTAGGNGGGIFLFFSSNSSIVENTMTSNTARDGGGIYVSGGKVTISDNAIENNTATDDVGGAYLDGSDIKFFNNIVSSNIAKDSIGGVDIIRGTVSNNLISKNSAENGIGGISLYSATVTNNTIDGNSGLNGIVTIKRNGTFQYNTIINNSTTKSADITSTIWVDASLPLIKYNNIFGNTATYELWHDNKHGSNNVSAENNWWGTNDESAILAMIYDYFDNSEKGRVNYAPWESAIRTDAGKDAVPPPPDLTLTINKAGKGNVTGNGIDCGSVCTKEYTKNTAVILTAKPTEGYLFAGWSGAGCSGTGNCTVTMNESQTVTATFNEETPASPPNAAFSTSATQGEAPLTVTLDASSSTDSDGTIVKYAWKASDGQQAAGKNSQLTFAHAGSYSITLTVTDNDGLTHTAKGNVIVTPKPVAPVAKLTLSPAKGDAPLTVLLNASSSTDSDGTIVKYAWKASDGQQAAGKNSQLTFAHAGSYSITLTVTDNDGLTHSAKGNVTVTAKSVAPVAKFTLSSTKGNAPFTVLLNASDSTDSDGTIVKYAWKASNGQQAAGKNSQLTFAHAGSYSITLTVTDNDGLTDTAKGNVTAEEPDTADDDDDNNADDDDDKAYLEFIGLEDLYEVGETVVMELVETANRDKYTRVDLWMAVQLPSEAFLFRTGIPMSPWSPQPQAHKISIENAETSHYIFDFELPEGMGGDYTLYAVYVEEGENPVTNGFSHRSNLVIRQIFLANRKD